MATDELRSWCVNKLVELGLGGLEDLVDYLLTIQDPDEAKTYLESLLGADKSAKAFIVEYLHKLETPQAPAEQRGDDQLFAGTSSKGKRNRRDRRRGADRAEPRSEPRSQASTEPRTEQQNGARGVQPQSDAPNVQFAEILMERVRQARRNHEIVNCLRCGKVYREVPMGGYCTFCGAALFGDDAPELWGTATQKKDRLLEFDRTSAKRTVVYDDDNDFFEMTTTNWMSAEEEQKAKAEREQARQDAAEAARKITFTLDIGGRKVLVDSEPGGAGTQGRAAASTDVADDDGDAGAASRASRSTPAPSGSSRPLLNSSLGKMTPQFVRSSEAVDIETEVHLAEPSLRVQRDEYAETQRVL